jgi:hypothetical protein
VRHEIRHAPFCPPRTSSSTLRQQAFYIEGRLAVGISADRASRQIVRCPAGPIVRFLNAGHLTVRPLIGAGCGLWVRRRLRRPDNRDRGRPKHMDGRYRQRDRLVGGRRGWVSSVGIRHEAKRAGGRGCRQQAFADVESEVVHPCTSVVRVRRQ